MHTERAHAEVLNKTAALQHKSRLLKTQLVTPAVNVAPNVTFSVTDCLLASFKKHTEAHGQHLSGKRGVQFSIYIVCAKNILIVHHFCISNNQTAL